MEFHHLRYFRVPAFSNSSSDNPGQAFLELGQGRARE